MSQTRDELVSHRDELIAISTKHFQSRRRVIDAIAGKHFESASAVFSRHSRHLSDIPDDMLNPLKKVWNPIAKRFSPNLKVRIKKTAKEKEIEKIIINELLSLQLLQDRLAEYVEKHVAKSSRKLRQSLKGWSSAERLRVVNAAMKEADNISSNAKTVRSAASVMIATAAGTLLAKQIKIGAYAAGTAAATSAYTASLSFPALLWSKVFGVPTYVAMLGGVGGVIVTFGIAPLVFPLAELAVNQLNSRNMLRTIVDNAENRLTSKRAKVVTQLSTLCSYYDRVMEHISRFATPGESEGATV